MDKSVGTRQFLSYLKKASDVNEVLIVGQALMHIHGLDLSRVPSGELTPLNWWLHHWSKSSRTPAQQALFKQLFELFVVNGANINANDEDNGIPLLIHAALVNDVFTFDLVIQQPNINLNTISFTGWPALTTAVHTGNPYTIDKLLTRYAELDFDITDSEGKTAQDYATQPIIVTKLLDARNKVSICKASLYHTLIHDPILLPSVLYNIVAIYMFF